MKRSVQIILAVISIIGAIGAGLYGRNAYLYQVSTLMLPVPRASIQPYTILTPDLFEMREFPRALETMPYYQTVENLTGKISTSKLQAGLPVANIYAVAVKDFRLASEDLEVLSIPIRPVSGVGGQIRIGDMVNLYVMMVVEVDDGTVVSLNPSIPGQGGTGGQVGSPQAAVLTNYRPEREGLVEMIADGVMVVDIRSGNAEPAGPDSPDKTEDPANPQNGEERALMQILTIAVSPDMVDAILKAVVESEKSGGLLWATLAIPQ